MAKTNYLIHLAESVIPAPADALFDWHSRPGAFQRLGPPGQKMKIVKQEGTITDGSVLRFKIYQGPIPVTTWEAHHDHYEEGRQFRDVQVKGPFSMWKHTHTFLPGPDPEHTSILRDEIHYRLPFAPLSHWLFGFVFRKMLNDMFAFRHRRTMDDLTRHQQYADQPRQHVLMTGASGLIGTALRNFLTTGGHKVSVITRNEDRARKQEDTYHWDIDAQEIDLSGISEPVDTVIHLAGESVNQRWDAESKKRIMQSRSKGTTLLCDGILSLETPPKTLISVSAVGYYGTAHGDRKLVEGDPQGEDFLAQVCEVWEQQSKRVKEAGVRVVNPRFGVVLSPDGGALDQMLLPFKMGAGGRVGSGEQWMSWVALDDVVGALYHIMFTPALEDEVNVTAPNPVTNKVFTKALGSALNRPTVIPVPNLALYALIGKEAAQAILLKGQRVLPKKLQDSGFEFLHPEIEETLETLVG